MVHGISKGAGKSRKKKGNKTTDEREKGIGVSWGGGAVLKRGRKWHHPEKNRRSGKSEGIRGKGLAARLDGKGK